MKRRAEEGGKEFQTFGERRIKGFEDYLIFYRPLADGVEIVRVLHGKRNIPTILEDEEFQGKGK